LFCCWLKVHGKETAGHGADLWTWKRVDDEIKDATEALGTIVLPLATIIETGNHIAQAADKRFEHATTLCKHLRDAVESRSPWVAFREQSSFWSDDNLINLIDDWPTLAAKRMSFADVTIKYVADFYSEAGFDVKILTADKELRAYEPIRVVQLPRRAR
jgi:hypothetical protein